MNLHTHGWASPRPRSYLGRDLDGSGSNFTPRYYGKGPTKAKTHIFDDTVVCTLMGGFTAVEQTLIEAGEGESVYRDASQLPAGDGGGSSNEWGGGHRAER